MGEINTQCLVPFEHSRYVYDTCGKRFTRNWSMTAHSSIHTGESPHVCGSCGKSFALKSNLKAHSSIHTGERPHVCGTCGKRFRLKCNLKTHSSIHTEERPHVCGTCGKQFRLKGTLMSHSLIHAAQTPHVCATCGKEFRYIRSLVRHRTVHTEGKPYLCRTCGSTFKHKGNLTKHRKSCNKSHKITGIFAELLNTNSGNASVSKPAGETVEIENRTQSPTDTEALFEDALSLIQKSPSFVAIKAKGTSFAQNFGTVHDVLDAPKRGGQLTPEDKHNVELQSNCTSDSWEFHGFFRMIHDSITCNNLTVPVERDSCTEKPLHPLQLEAFSWNVHEQAFTSMNGSSASSSRAFGGTSAWGFLPDDPSATFVGWDYPESSPYTSAKTFFDLGSC